MKSKLNLVTLGMIIAAFGIISCKKGGSGSKSPDNPKLKTKMDSVSYALGQAIGQNLKMNLKVEDSTGFNFEITAIAMQRAIAGDSILFSDMQQNMIMEAFQNGQRDIVEAEMKKKNAPIVANNEKLGNEFLAKNKAMAGVITTASGLQYKIIKAGTGPKPTLEQKVKAHYTGKFLDGKIFDSSIERGEPIVFGLKGGVIPGWNEAIQLMPVGSKWELYIPSNLAYGERGERNQQGQTVIPGGSTLVFEVELLGIENEKPQESLK